MATILLSRHSGTEDPQSSLYHVFSGIEHIVQRHHNVIKMKMGLCTKQALGMWILENAMASDLFITNTPYAIQFLRENGWQGKVIFKALGSLPRGAGTVRDVLPYLYQTDFIWCTSTADMRIYSCLVEQDGIQPEAVLLPYSVDCETYSPLNVEKREQYRQVWGFKPQDFVLVYAGRVTIEKNVHSILDVVHELVHQGYPVKLVIAGRIEDVSFREFRLYHVNLSEDMQTLIETLELSKRVTIQGWLAPKQLNELFSAADALINLTLHHDENFGLSQVEAMSSGLPVIGTAWGGLKDTIIDAETGFSIDTWTSTHGIRLTFPLCCFDQIACCFPKRTA